MISARTASAPVRQQKYSKKIFFAASFGRPSGRWRRSNDVAQPWLVTSQPHAAGGGSTKSGFSVLASRMLGSGSGSESQRPALGGRVEDKLGSCFSDLHASSSVNNARARALARAVEKLRTLAASPSSPGLRDYSKLLPLQRPARLLQATFPAAICKALLQATASAATCKALETAPSYCLCSDLQGFRDYSKLLPLQRSARL